MSKRQQTVTGKIFRVTAVFALAALHTAAMMGQRSASSEHWLSTWSTSVQIPEPQNSLTPADMTDTTIRQIVHLSIGGTTVRVHLSNAFGTRPLHLFSAHIAKSTDLATSKIDIATEKELTFNGLPDVIIPPGAQYISDPIAFPAAKLSDVALTIHFDQSPTPETGHPGSRATTYITNGDHVSDAEFPGPMTAAQTMPTPRPQLVRPPAAGAPQPSTQSPAQPPSASASPTTSSSSATQGAVNQIGPAPTDLSSGIVGFPTGTRTIEHWYTISGIDVLAPAKDFVVVAVGDSITDGHATTTNGNNRWTDVMNNKLQSSPATSHIAVVNAGIGGNHLLVDGLGPNVLSRLDRDMNQAGARYLIVFEAVNDLGGRLTTPQQHTALVERIIGAYQQIVARAHAQGLTVIGATITPDGGSQYNRAGAAGDADRLAINSWITSPGHFDEVIDFASAIADPSDPSKMAAAYDSGDHLHPGVAGYKVLGELFTPGMFGVNSAAPIKSKSKDKAK